MQVNFFQHFTLIIVISSFFYILLPGLGAFYTRSKWRLFRKQLINSTLIPDIGYKEFMLAKDEHIGKFRFFGSLQAMHDNLIILNNKQITVHVEMKKALVYVLRAGNIEKIENSFEEVLTDQTPEKVTWNKVFSLPEGSSIFVCGNLYNENDQAVFKTIRKIPATVIIFEGDPEKLLKQTIWGGRHHNEYWNKLTPGAITAGSFSLFILSYIYLRNPLARFPAIISLAFSLIPLIPLLPPGVILYYLYRYFWKKGRTLRAERDIISLPLHYFNDIPEDFSNLSTKLPNGDIYTVKKYVNMQRALDSCKNAIIRKCSLVKESKLIKKYYVFGVTNANGDFIDSKDNMAETIIIPDNPEKLAKLCNLKAYINEIIAVFFFAAGFVMNLLLAIFVLSFFIR